MQHLILIDDEVTVGPQPSSEELEELSRQGFRSIVNFRTGDEDEQPLSPEAEQKEVEAAGLAYLHIPVTLPSLTPQAVDNFRARFVDLPKPVFAHCKKGTRAAAMLLMHVGATEGISGPEAILRGKKLGMEIRPPAMEDFVVQYIDRARLERSDGTSTEAAQ